MRATTLAPRRAPTARPWSLSCGKWIPPHRRDNAASSASARKNAPSSGNVAARTAAAAAEIVEWPDVYDGKFGVGITVTRPGMRWIGRAVQYVYFVAQQAMKPSAIAMLRKAWARDAALASRPRDRMRSLSFAFQIAGGGASPHSWTIATCSGVRPAATATTAATSARSSGEPKA